MFNLIVFLCFFFLVHADHSPDHQFTHLQGEVCVVDFGGVDYDGSHMHVWVKDPNITTDCCAGQENAYPPCDERKLQYYCAYTIHGCGKNEHGLQLECVGDVEQDFLGAVKWNDEQRHETRCSSVNACGNSKNDVRAKHGTCQPISKRGDRCVVTKGGVVEVVGPITCDYDALIKNCEENIKDNNTELDLCKRDAEFCPYTLFSCGNSTEAKPLTCRGDFGERWEEECNGTIKCKEATRDGKRGTCQPDEYAISGGWIAFFVILVILLCLCAYGCYRNQGKIKTKVIQFREKRKGRQIKPKQYNTRDYGP